MMDHLLQQAIGHVQQFLKDARLHKKKGFREINDAEVLLYAFFLTRRRMLQPKRYTVHESSRLAEATLKPEVLRDYEALKTAWREKGDLKKFHTENSKILYPIDGLLEDCGINHLHLDRCRYQVYFRTEGTEIYVIHIVSHFGRGHTGYAKENLLHILEENWPGRFGVSKLKHVRPQTLTTQYGSRYGWHAVEEFYRWLNEQQAQLPEAPQELAFEENERFVLRLNGANVGIPLSV